MARDVDRANRLTVASGGVITEAGGNKVLTLAGGTAIRGELVAVGTVATVDTGPGGRTAYVPLAAIVSVISPD